MEPNQIFIQNLKTLLWLGNRNFLNRSYQDYIRQVALSCSMEYDTFMKIVQGNYCPNPQELSQIIEALAILGYDLEGIETKQLFPRLKDTAGPELLDLSIQHLILSIPTGQQGKFAKAIGVNQSTLCRWKQRKTRPDTYAKRQIANYFGFESQDEIMLSFIFLGLEPFTDAHKKLYCQNQIDLMDTEAFRKIYPALVKLLK